MVFPFPTASGGSQLPVASCPLPCHKLNRLEALFKIQSNGICNTNRQARIMGQHSGAGVGVAVAVGNTCSRGKFDF